MKKVVKGIIFTIISIFIIMIIYVLILILKYRNFQEQYILNQISKIDLNNYNKLMIVAHPDDEMIFGGAELINEDYLVICVTCGSNKTRAKEFENVMKETNDKFIMLNYTDLILFFRSKWILSEKFIKRDMNIIKEIKEWEKVVTHNKNGEYGHIHHKKVNRIVNEVFDKNTIYTFGKYCSFKKIENKECTFEYRLDENVLEQKNKILYENYKTQVDVLEKLKHIFPFENIIID